MSEGLASGQKTYVLFRLGTGEYALPVSSVVSIIRYELPTCVPRSTGDVLGVVNLRGRVLPVVDLGTRFGGAPFEANALSRIIVTEGLSGGVGIVADSANEVVTFDDEEIKPVPASILGSEAARAFVGMVERESGLVVVLDPEEAMPKYDSRAMAVAKDADEGVVSDG